MRTRATLLVAAFCLPALASCAPDDKAITQLILAADTNMAEVDSVRFRVSAPDQPDELLAESAHVAGGEPAYVSVVRGERALGPIIVTATALSQGQARLVRTQRVSFVPDETRMVLLHLFASCVGPTAPQCDPTGQTCAAMGCIDQLLGEADLLPWTGSPPRLDGTSAMPPDASVEDAGTPSTGVEDAGKPPTMASCPGGNFDTTSDVNHCGSCDTACTQPIPPTLHAVNVCRNSACDYACVAGWGACDDKLENGCEADLTRPERCGSCLNRCDKGQMCIGGTCGAP